MRLYFLCMGLDAKMEIKRPADLNLNGIEEPTRAL